ncbi:MAG: hypothetical protein ACI9DO_003354, partial [Reinekea sp.]
MSRRSLALLVTTPPAQPLLWCQEYPW